MGHIFCLMGKSASGKDTIYRLLLEKPDLHLKRVIPYTTRPIREGEKEGENYYFRDEAFAGQLEKEKRIIEMRAYHTVYGIWKYFTADDGQIQPEAGDYLLIGTLEAYLKVRAYFGPEKVIPIYVEVEDGERLKRAIAREETQAAPKYEEMCRRFLADAADFSEENLQKAGVTVRFENRRLEDAVREIASYIKRQ